jgi:hypothetical protein
VPEQSSREAEVVTNECNRKDAKIGCAKIGREQRVGRAGKTFVVSDKTEAN